MYILNAILNETTIVAVQENFKKFALHDINPNFNCSTRERESFTDFREKKKIITKISNVLMQDSS